MAHGTSGQAAGTSKRGLGKQGAYDPRFVQRGEKINPQSKENFSSSFLIRGVVILNVASGIACECRRLPGERFRVIDLFSTLPESDVASPQVQGFERALCTVSPV